MVLSMGVVLCFQEGAPHLQSHTHQAARQERGTDRAVLVLYHDNNR